MLYNVPRMLGDWFQDPTHGANALLPSVPRDVDTPLPADFAVITTETQDGNTARSQLPVTKPCLTVAVDHVLDEDGQIQEITGDGKVKVRCRVGIDNADTAAAIAELGIRLRAVKWSLRRFTDERVNPAHDASRTRNGVYIETCNTLASQIIWAKDQQDTAIVSGYVIAEFQARDQTPTGP